MDFHPLQNGGFVNISIDTHEGHDLVADILEQIAKEKNQSPERIKHLLFNKRKPHLNQRFWELLHAQLPHHGFEYVGCCAECGAFELR